MIEHNLGAVPETVLGTEDPGYPLLHLSKLGRLPSDASLALRILRLVDDERTRRGSDAWVIDELTIIEDSIPETAGLRSQVVNPIVLLLPRPFLRVLTLFDGWQRVEF